MAIGIWQLGFTALFSGILALWMGETSISFNPLGWVAILGLAFISSAYGYIAQTVPERIGFLYALEPVFCGVLAFIFFREIMSLKEIFGAILILLSIVL